MNHQKHLVTQQESLFDSIYFSVGGKFWEARNKISLENFMNVLMDSFQ